MASFSPALPLVLLALRTWAGPVTVEPDARRLERELIAPCCWSQQVSVHASPAADQMRRDIRVALASGQSIDQVRAAYVARYGPRILAEPPAAGFAALLYWWPTATALLSFATLIALLRRFSRRAALSASTAPPVTTPVENDRVQAELEQLD